MDPSFGLSSLPREDASPTNAKGYGTAVAVDDTINQYMHIVYDIIDMDIRQAFTDLKVDAKTYMNRILRHKSLGEALSMVLFVTKKEPSGTFTLAITPKLKAHNREYLAQNVTSCIIC
jgi:phosphoglucomutase